MPQVADFIERYGLRALKTMGQNFICDLNITDRIARAVPGLAGSVVVEVGPGPAGLTRSLLANGAAKVVAIELDARAIGILEEIRGVYGERLEIIQADAMEVDFSAFGEEVRICANLPYNISVPLLVRWVFMAERVPSMTLMFQKEVARRICARPHSRDYGRISVLAQLAYSCRVLFDVAPRCFVPAPKVVSSVVGFTRLAERPSVAELARVEEIAKAAFGQRRKMLRQSLKGIFTEQALLSAGLRPELRAEQLSPQDFLRLARL